MPIADPRRHLLAADSIAVSQHGNMKVTQLSVQDQLERLYSLTAGALSLHLSTHPFSLSSQTLIQGL